MKIVPALLLLLSLFILFCIKVNAQKPSDVVGVWELGGQQRKYSVTLILRQENNLYPSFWAGTRESGTLSILTKPDILGDRFSIESKGGMLTKFNKTAPKPGMENILPGGVWASNLSEENLVVNFTGFENWQIQKDTKQLTLTANVAGEVSISNRKAPLSGEATFKYDEKTPKWSLSTKCEFTGKTIGLPENQAGKIQLELHTLSPVSKMTPKLPTTEFQLDF
jgi:hypothetical protein